MPAVGWTVCATLAGLSKQQRSICRQWPDATAAAVGGLRLAVRECQHQFRAHRWNCSVLSTRSENPQSSSLFKKGFRETAFSYAISAAGVTHAVARACSMGHLLACGCEHRPYAASNVVRLRRLDRSRWKWGGCSHNLNFGIGFSKIFLDSSDRNFGDVQTLVKTHNYEAGRLAVLSETNVQCKCHGLSGSCQLKTCWRSVSEFRQVGDALKKKFRFALLVDQSNAARGPPIVVRPKRGPGSGSRTTGNRGSWHSVKRNQVGSRKDAIGSHENTVGSRKDGVGSTGDEIGSNSDTIGSNSDEETIGTRRGTVGSGENVTGSRVVMIGSSRPRRKSGRSRRFRRYKAHIHVRDLLYYQKSPNFCDRDETIDYPGTRGRQCNATSTGMDGCDSLCCGRGYDVVGERRKRQCDCTFRWCCNITCRTCAVNEWVTVCK